MVKVNTGASVKTKSSRQNPSQDGSEDSEFLRKLKVHGFIPNKDMDKPEVRATDVSSEMAQEIVSGGNPVNRSTVAGPVVEAQQGNIPSAMSTVENSESPEMPKAPQPVSRPDDINFNLTVSSEVSQTPSESVLSRVDNVVQSMGVDHNKGPEMKVIPLTMPVFPQTKDSAIVTQLMANMRNAYTEEAYAESRKELTQILERQKHDGGSVKPLPAILHNLSAWEINPDGRYVFSRDFASTLSVVTEKVLSDAFMGSDQTTEEEFSVIEDENAEVQNVAMPIINPMDLAFKTGSEIEKWLAVERQGSGGQSQDRPLTELEKLNLGAFALQVYQLSNPDMVISRPLNADESQKYEDFGTGNRYIPTNAGHLEFQNGRGLLQEAFGVVVEPLHSKPVGNDLRGLLGKFKPSTKTEKHRTAVALESLDNQSSVGHVVDDRRAKILILLIRSSILDKPIADNKFADVFGVGKAKLDSLIVRFMHDEVSPKSREEATEISLRIIEIKKRNLLKQLESTFVNRNLVNYFTYFLQPLTSRPTVNQTVFNYQSSKIIRFVTRSPVPVVVNRGSKEYDNILQMYGTILLGGQVKDNEGNVIHDLSDEGLMRPASKLKALRKYVRPDGDQKIIQFEKWGNMLKDAVGVHDNKNMNRLTSAFKNKVPIGSQQFPTLYYDNLSSLMDNNPHLAKYLLDFGEDLPHVMETLIDFSEFIEAMRNNNPHTTFLNAYVDGKTNGNSAQGLQIGSQQIARLSGVLQSADSNFILMEVDGKPIDMRGYLKNYMIGQIKLGNYSKLPRASHDTNVVFKKVLLELSSYKALNKSINMIFGYGKSEGSLDQEVRASFYEYLSGNPEFETNVKLLLTLGVPHTKIIEAQHANIVAALMDLFGKDTFKAKSVMQNSALLSAAMGVPLEIESATGHPISMGGRVIVPSTTTVNSVKIKDKRTGESSTLNIESSDKVFGAQAKKRHFPAEPAGIARGSSAVIPTQSTDGSTMILLTTGKSWEELGADPYFAQIFDAIKVDVTSFAPAVSNVNNIWYDINMPSGMNWNYFEKARKSVNASHKAFLDEFKGKDPDEEVILEGRFAYLSDLVNGIYIKDPKTGKERLTFNGASSFIKSVVPLKETDTIYSYKSRVMEEAARFINNIRNSLGYKSNVKVNEFKTTDGDTVVYLTSEGLDSITSLSNRDIIRLVEHLFSKSNYNKTMTDFVALVEKNKKILNDQVKETGFDIAQFTTP